MEREYEITGAATFKKCGYISFFPVAIFVLSKLIKVLISDGVIGYR